MRCRWTCHVKSGVMTYWAGTAGDDGVKGQGLGNAVGHAAAARPD